MPRKKISTLTCEKLRLKDVVWERGETRVKRHAHAVCLANVVGLSDSGAVTNLATDATLEKKQIYHRLRMILRSDKDVRKSFSRVKAFAFLWATVVTVTFSVLVAAVNAMPGKANELKDILSNPTSFESLSSKCDLSLKVSSTSIDSDALLFLDDIEIIASIYNKPNPTLKSKLYAAVNDYDYSEEDADIELDGVKIDLADADGSTIIFSNDDEVVTCIWKDGNYSLTVEFEGEIIFANDDRDVAAISRGGSIRISERKGRNRQRLEIYPDKDKKLQYEYYRGNSREDFDQTAREWFEDVLIKAIRESGIGAEDRAARIMEEGGIEAVLTEVKIIESDYISSVYLRHVIDQGDLPHGDLIELIDLIGIDIESDYERAELLIGLADLCAGDRDLIFEYVGAVKDIDSDYEIRRVLSSLDYEYGTDEETAETYLGIVSGMDSDYEKTELVMEIVDQIEANETLVTLCLEIAKTIDSDYEANRIFKSLLKGKGIDRKHVPAILKVAGTMDSDYEKAELLLYTAQNIGIDQNLIPAYVKALRNIDSDYEFKRSLMALGKVEPVDENVTVEILDMIEYLSSDFEKAEILIDLAESFMLSQNTRDAYLKAIESVDSDWEISRIFDEISTLQNLDTDFVRGSLAIITAMSSDYEKAKILHNIAEYCLYNDELETAFEAAVESIDSEYERDRLYAHFYRMYKQGK
jgi:predicted regulator of amino acid metabolism with ACT domain